MNINSYNINSPLPFEQPHAQKRRRRRKIFFLVVLCIVIILVIILQTAPRGAVREVQQIYKSLGGTDKFVTVRSHTESGVRMSTSLLFEYPLFSPGEISVLGTISTSGLIIMAGITIVEDTCTWRIEAMYDGKKYGSGSKAGMQNVTYSGKINAYFFNADEKLAILETESSDPVSSDLKKLLLKYGAQLMAQALDDLNAVMEDYSVRDLGFQQFT